jgi:hypothetical protein
LAATDVNRETALATADKIVAEWTEQVKNPRGYVHDKWSPVDLEARTRAVLRIAEFLLVPTGPLVAPDAPEPHVHRASCDGSIGEHLCGYP